VTLPAAGVQPDGGGVLWADTDWVREIFVVVHAATRLNAATNHRQDD